MDVLLHKHRAKHIANTPDGLPELCSDISREVIRSQPLDIYCFISDYLHTLLITRENAKVAIRIVQSVTLKSEHIVEILVSTGLRLEEIAAVAPRLQQAFKVYLDAVDEQKKECGCDADSDADDQHEISICQILRASGASYPDAQRAAIRIQALFRGHQERMSLGESRGEVQWQRAAVRTVELLRKCGITRPEATRAAIIIQAAYRGYYTRKNFNKRLVSLGKKPKVNMCAWYRMMLEENGITAQRANQAAIVIQVAFRGYRKRKASENLSSVRSTATRATTMASSRKTPSEVPSSARSMKSEMKSELKSESDTKTESKIGDTDNEVKDDGKEEASARSVKSEVKDDGKGEASAGSVKSEVKSEAKSQAEAKDVEGESKIVAEDDENAEEQVKTEEEAADEAQPEASETEVVENADEAAGEPEDQAAKEVEGEGGKEAAEE